MPYGIRCRQEKINVKPSHQQCTSGGNAKVQKAASRHNFPFQNPLSSHDRKLISEKNSLLPRARPELAEMSRHLIPFVRKSLTRKEPQLFPLIALVGGGLGVGVYYFVRHAVNSPELVVYKSQRADYAAGDMSEHVPENDPTFSILRRLKDKPIATFDKDQRYSMRGLHQSGAQNDGNSNV